MTGLMLMALKFLACLAVMLEENSSQAVALMFCRAVLRFDEKLEKF